MPASKTPTYRLTPKAVTDLEHIWLYTLETWSLAQADAYIDALTAAFQRLAAMPTIARERREFTPPVRIHPVQSHLVIYHTTDDGIVVLRVLGGQQDWQDLMREGE